MTAPGCYRPGQSHDGRTGARERTGEPSASQPNPLYDAWLSAGPYQPLWGISVNATVPGGGVLGLDLLGRDGTDQQRSQWAENIDRKAGLRHTSCSSMAWAVPDEETLDYLACYGPFVESGAGLGYWAWQLRMHGADVIAYDPQPHHVLDGYYRGHGINPFHRHDLAWSWVLQGNAAAVVNHPDRTLLVVWPPYVGLDWGEDEEDFEEEMYDDPGWMAVRFFRDAGGQRVAYVGESPNSGCNGGPVLQAELRDHWCEVETRLIPQWEGIHDELTIYERKDPA